MFTLLRSAVATPFRWWEWLWSHHIGVEYPPAGAVSPPVVLCKRSPADARAFCWLEDGHPGPCDLFEW